MIQNLDFSHLAHFLIAVLCVIYVMEPQLPVPIMTIMKISNDFVISGFIYQQ